jgi:Ca2+-binding EF-hand superfamily protein
MSQANPQADLIDIFNQIDKDKDGFISRADL